MHSPTRQHTADHDTGFTLIEVLMVVVLLGILAAIVVFSLSGVASKSMVTACATDAKTVDVAGRALATENPNQIPVTAAAWKSSLLPGSTLTGAPFLHSWPTSPDYAISVAGSGAPTTTGDTVAPANGDVIVTTPTGIGALTYDATQHPGTACSTA